MIKKILIVVVCLLACAIFALSTFKNEIANLYFRYKNSKIINVSNIRIKPRQDFVILSDKDPVIIAIKDSGIVIDITKLESAASLQIYQKNFKILGKKTIMTNFNVGSRYLPAIKIVNDGVSSKEEIKILLDPKLVLTIKVDGGTDKEKNLKRLKEFLNTDVIWVR